MRVILATDEGAAASGGWVRGAAVLGSAAMVAAPLALLAAIVLHPPHGIDGASWFAAAVEGPGRFEAAHLLMLIAVALFAPAALALAELLRPARPATASIGSALSILGLLAIAVLIGMDFFAAQVARSAIDSGQGLALLESTVTSPVVVAPVALLLPGLIAGPALLALALYRERILSGWATVSIPLGLVGVFAGLPVAPVALAGAALLVVAFGGLGVALLINRRPIAASKASAAQPLSTPTVGALVSDPPRR